MSKKETGEEKTQTNKQTKNFFHSSAYHAYVVSRMKFRPPLTHDDVSRYHVFSAKFFDAQELWVRVSAVLRSSSGLLRRTVSPREKKKIEMERKLEDQKEENKHERLTFE